jgi:phosphatidylglycerophosphatase A
MKNGTRKTFLTFFYTGLLPKAPGTWGSIAGTIVGILILQYLTVQTLFLSCILITIIAINEINKEEKHSGIHDSSEIVIDEVAGVWLAMSLSGATMIQIVLSLIFFRVFDIWKPSVIGKIDREVKGGLGVMGDDIVAGIFAGIASAGVYQGLGYFGLI